MALQYSECTRYVVEWESALPYLVDPICITPPRRNPTPSCPNFELPNFPIPIATRSVQGKSYSSVLTTLLHIAIFPSVSSQVALNGGPRSTSLV